MYKQIDTRFCYLFISMESFNLIKKLLSLEYESSIPFRVKKQLQNLNSSVILSRNRSRDLACVRIEKNKYNKYLIPSWYFKITKTTVKI